MPAKITYLGTERAEILKGGGAWPPASPYVWQDSWWDTQGNQRSIILSWRFDSPVNGGGTNTLQGLDYDLDPQCPWEILIVVRADGVRITQQIPRTARTGTIGPTPLANRGLNTFLDIGSITVGQTA